MITLVMLLLSQPVLGPVKPVYFSGDSLDAGLSSAPCLVDWNEDGLTDILIGTRTPYTPSTLTIFDCSGRQVTNRTVNNGNINIDMQNLPPEVYTVVLNTSNGNATQRVTVIEH